MRKFLSLIVVLMLCFNAKAQFVTVTKAVDFEFSTDLKDKTLFEVLDGGQHALLYFMNCGSDTYTSIINGVYNNLGKNQNDVYLIGLDPSNESALLNNWATLNGVEYPLVAKDKAYSISLAYGGSYGVTIPTLVLIAPNHDIILKEIWPISSIEQVVGKINDNLVEVDEPSDGSDEETPVEPETPGEGEDEGGDTDQPSGDENEDGNNEGNDPIKPDMPKVVATATATTITLTWDAVEGATEYNIFTPDGFATNILGLTETSYTFEGLTPETEYCFEVSAVFPTDESDMTKVCATTKANEEESGEGEEPTPEEPGDGGDEEPGEDPAEPEEPEDGDGQDPSDDENNPTIPVELAMPKVSATATETTITLTWEAVEGATNYNIYTPAGFDEHIYGITDTTYTFDNLISGNRYCFSVSARDDIGYESDATEVCITTGSDEEVKPEDPENPGGDNPTNPAGPAVPTNLVATLIGDTVVSFSWNTVDGAFKYRVYEGTGLLDEVRETSYTVNGLLSEKRYCFKVSAVDLRGNEGDAAELCVTTKKLGEEPEISETPVAPVVTATATSDSTIVLTWNIVENATSYNVYDTALVLISNVTDTTYTVDNLEANTEYSFIVKAVNDTLESVASNVVTATTLSGEGIIENIVTFYIYPNPASSEVKIISIMNGEANVAIYDLTGRCVKNIRVADISNATINVSDINKGVYFINVNGNVEKLIVNN